MFPGTDAGAAPTLAAATPAKALHSSFDDLCGQVAVSMRAALEGRRDPTIPGRCCRHFRASG